VLSSLANEWAAEHEVTIVTLDSVETDFYLLDERIDRVALGVLRPSHSIFQYLVGNADRVRLLRRTIRSLQADAVVSFIDKMNVLVIVAAQGLDVPVVVSERSDPMRHDIGRFASFLRRLTYPRASAVVAQTDYVAEWVSHFVRAQRIQVIPNPVFEIPRAKLDVKLPDGAPLVVGVGRLVPVKGFDLLIDAFAEARAARTEWQLVIVGDGPDRSSLRERAHARGIGDAVHLVGRSAAVSEVMRRAELFVLSSRYEGFPNALIEAMAQELAVISFSCSAGPRRIIRDGVDGVLVKPGDAAALATTMGRIMDDPDLRRRLGVHARSVRSRFAHEKVLTQWDALFHELTLQKRRVRARNSIRERTITSEELQ
jgi:glycosyltransferase involved in cell wall biosynthesis